MKVTQALASTAIIVTINSLHAAPGVPAEVPTPENGIVDGYENSSGFRPDAGQHALRYPAPPELGSYGTVSAWVNLDDPLTASGSVLSGGNPGEGWVLLQISEGKLSFLLQKGVKPFAGDGECYLNLSIPLDDWEPGTWHHVAAAWDARGPGQSLAALYVDGELVEERNTVSLAEGWGPEVLFVGSSSASAAASRIAGTIDGVAVFPFAVPPNQITALMEGDYSGAALATDFESGFDAQDFRQNQDDAAARAESRAQWSF